MSKISVIARLVSKPETNAEVKAVFEGLVASTASEDGTEVYALNQDSADPNVFWFFELYADNDALTVHGGSAAMADAFTTLAEALAEPPALHVLTPLQAKGLSLGA